MYLHRNSIGTDDDDDDDGRRRRRGRRRRTTTMTTTTHFKSFLLIEINPSEKIYFGIQKVKLIFHRWYPKNRWQVQNLHTTDQREKKNVSVYCKHRHYSSVSSVRSMISQKEQRACKNWRLVQISHKEKQKKHSQSQSMSMLLTPDHSGLIQLTPDAPRLIL